MNPAEIAAVLRLADIWPVMLDGPEGLYLLVSGEEDLELFERYTVPESQWSIRTHA